VEDANISQTAQLIRNINEATPNVDSIAKSVIDDSAAKIKFDSTPAGAKLRKASDES